MPWACTLINPLCPRPVQYLTLCVEPNQYLNSTVDSECVISDPDPTLLIFPFSDFMHLSRHNITLSGDSILARPSVYEFYVSRTSLWDNLINAYRALVLIHLLVCEVSHLLERIHRDEHRPWSFSTAEWSGFSKIKGTQLYPISKGLWRRSLQILFSLYVLYCGAGETLNLCIVKWRNPPVRST